MSKLILLHAHYRLAPKTVSSILTHSKPLSPSLHLNRQLLSSSSRSPFHSFRLRRHLSLRAFDDSSSESNNQQLQRPVEDDKDGGMSTESKYPAGEFEYEKFDAWKSFLVKLRMLLAFPWERVRKGSVLKMTLRGQVPLLLLFYNALM